ncbi:unnamed protein product, partial [Menidia menidia]
METRLHQLAQPKPNQLQFPDRRSVYWLEKLPPETTRSTTKIELTPRWSDLCKTKKFYTKVTVSPVWEVSEWALQFEPSKRLCSMAEPRAPVAGWQPDRPLLAPLSRASLRAEASTRICQLAQPMRRQVLEGSSCRSKPLSLTHLASKASAHIELLATPKHNHPKFEGECSACWPISRAARRYVPTQRLLDLSCPKERTALFEAYDPYAVSRAARSAAPSPRIKELCLPLPRKCSS